MSSFIPRQPKVTRDRVEAKLEVELIQTLESYCEYLDSDRDYVIGQVLAIAFRKDKGFAEWLRSQHPAESGELPPEDAAPQAKKGAKSNRLRLAKKSSRGMAEGTGANLVPDTLQGSRE
jgi:hypothetical protein